MLLSSKIRGFIESRKCTMLGVGPMSKTCVDAAIDIANDGDIPIFLIASRRQIDCEEFGGGYVNNWTTREYSDYVRSRDMNGRIILARDHGGPWQNNLEKDSYLSLPMAMDSAKKSYEADIDAGFQVIHVDPSIDIHGKPSQAEIIDRACELIEFCWKCAKKKSKEIAFEIGTEEQSGSVAGLEVLEKTLKEVTHFCSQNKITRPLFVVAQCGTRVAEDKNIGCFESPIRIKDEIPSEIQLPLILRLCAQYGVLMKEHNADYLSNEGLRWHPKLGIQAANVAPEFGVCETTALINILESTNDGKLAEELLSIFYDSHHWEKWMLPKSNSSDRKKSILAGHYCFSFERVKQIKDRARNNLSTKGIDLDGFLKDAVKKAILRYIYCFRLLK